MSERLLLTGLPVIDPAEAELRRQLLFALTGRPWRRGPLRASIILGPPKNAPWFHCRNGSAFHLARLQGAIPPIRSREDGFDGIDAATALETAEPLLADVEAALGADLEPMSLEREPPWGLNLHLQAGRDHLFLVWPPLLEVVPAVASWSPALAAAIPLPLKITFSGPRLAPHDAAGLTAGDLLLLPMPPFECRLETGGWQGRALLDPIDRTIKAIASGIHQTENAMNDPAPSAGEGEAAGAPVGGDFTVPLTVELESALVPLRQLQALRQGAVLPLEGSGTLPVIVRVSGQRLAKGHLVSIGEGFGVLIDERMEG